MNVSREGLLFASPEAIDVGERIELRLLADEANSMVLRGSVVRLEELPETDRLLPDRFDIGVVFDAEEAATRHALLAFLEQARAPK